VFEENIRRTHRNEIAELILRYNPVFDSGEIMGVLAEPPPGDALREFTPAPYRDLLSAADANASDIYAGITREIRDLSVVFRQLRDVPYENAVPAALSHLEHRTAELTRRYEQLWQGLVDAVDERNQTISSREELISRYHHALTELTRDNRENGYVLDARDTDNILVFLDRVRDVPDGTLGYVFRRDDELIGIIRFHTEDNTVLASLVETSPDARIRPFDRILLQVQ
jgi:hypothetical protein